MTDCCNAKVMTVKGDAFNSGFMAVDTLMNLEAASRIVSVVDMERTIDASKDEHPIGSRALIFHPDCSRNGTVERAADLLYPLACRKVPHDDLSVIAWKKRVKEVLRIDRGRTYLRSIG